MAVESNKPYQKVDGGNNGIWDGAAWGLGAGAVATGMMYGATKHGAQHLSSINQGMAMSKSIKADFKNSARAAAGKKHLDSAALDARKDKIFSRADSVSSGLGKVGNAGNFMFGQGKWGTGGRAAITSGIGLLGGAGIGMGIDALNG